MTARQIEAKAKADIEASEKKKPTARKKEPATKAKEQPEPEPIDPLEEKGKSFAVWLTNGIEKISRTTGMVNDDDELGKDLRGDKLWLEDLASLTAVCLPYMPYPGIVTGVVTWVRHYLSRGKPNDLRPPTTSNAS